MMKTEKECRSCHKVRPIERFVDATGQQNPRGWFCCACHLDRLQASHNETLAEEQAKTPKLKIAYGEWWQHWAWPREFELTLYEELGFCPYCGEEFPPWYDRAGSDDRPFHGGPQIDHMDPVSKGGEDSIRNAVFVCEDCNYRKGAMLFVRWLKQLPPTNRELCRKLYIEKHGHMPEEFEVGLPRERCDGTSALMLLTEEEIKQMFPAPIVDGPP